MSSISAGLTSGTALVSSGDTTGELLLKTNGSTTAVTFGTDQKATFVADATIYGVTVGRGAGAVATNTAVGASALAANTTGYENVAVGSGALYTNANGYGNVSVGRNSLYVNTSGALNTAVGDVALRFNTTGNFNVALGPNALYSNTTASNNTAVGYQALYANTTGVNNVAFGNNALDANTTSSRNTAIGLNALTNLDAGAVNSENVAVGLNSAFFLSTGTQNTFLGTYAGEYATTGTYNTFVGWNSGGAITTGGKNTIIGRYNGNQGGLDIRTSDNFIVLSDGDGNPNMVAASQTEWLMRSGNGYWTLFSNGGGNSTSYNGTLIGANKVNLTSQSNTALPSWFIDIGGRAGDGSTRPTSTQDKFSVGRQAAGGTIYAAPNLFEVNQNGCVGLNTAASNDGTGITFPATQNASSDANTLDDYEEGSFSPTIATSGASVTYTHQAGNYTKVGRLVTFGISIVLNTVSSAGSGDFTIGGLPFASSSSDVNQVRYVIQASGVDWDATANQMYAYIPTTSSSVLKVLYSYDNGSWTPATSSTFAIAAGDIIVITGFYYV